MLNINTLRVCTTALALMFSILGAANASAVTVGYTFSGDFDFADPDVNGGGAPLSDLLPQLSGITSFSGSFSYEYLIDEVLVPNSPMVTPTTLHIDSLFGGAYPIGRTAPAPHDGIFISGSTMFFELGNFGAPGNPEITFQPGVFIENMAVVAEFDTLPTFLSEVDLTSPHVVSLQLMIRLKAPNPENENIPFIPVNFFPITLITPVPEPGTLALSGIAFLGALFVIQRKRIRS